MAGPLVYMVCSQDDLDPTTGACAHVAYVQAPTMLPPMDAATGSILAAPVIGLWYFVAVMRRLS